MESHAVYVSQAEVFADLVVKGLESLNDLGTGLYGEFERFDCLHLMTSLRNGAMTGGAERSRRDAERRVESSDKSKIGRDDFDLSIGEATFHNSQKIFDLTGAGGLPP
jgi:hypothetical protein